MRTVGDMSHAEVFEKDLERMNAHFRELGAVITGTDESGDYALIDPAKVNPAILSAYSNLLSYGYANGLIP